MADVDRCTAWRTVKWPPNDVRNLKLLGHWIAAEFARRHVLRRYKAGIPRHRHGHPRRLPREDRREDVGVLSGDFPVQLATSRTRTTILADLSADTRAFLREDVRYGCARVHRTR